MATSSFSPVLFPSTPEPRLVKEAAKKSTGRRIGGQTEGAKMAERDEHHGLTAACLPVRRAHADFHAILRAADLCPPPDSDRVSFSLAWDAKAARVPRRHASRSACVHHLRWRPDRALRRPAGHARSRHPLGGVPVERSHGLRLLDGPRDAGAPAYP